MQIDRHATTLADEASRYLDAVELARALGCHVRWRPEAVELSRRTLTSSTVGGATCTRCAGPLSRINGQHVCFGR